MRIKEFTAFIRERHNIWMRRKAAAPLSSGPFHLPNSRTPACACKVHWTLDPILQHFRFCNVYRELDTVTKWIADNWRTPHRGDYDLWFAMLVARKVNWPASLKEIGYPVPWKPERFIKVMKARSERKEQLESGAYMITAGTGADWKGVPKYEFLARAVFTPLWERRTEIRPSKSDTLASFHSRLEKAGNTVGSFIAGQVVADTKYTHPLSSAEDWMDWAAMGPGSARGLNRVIGLPVDARWKDWEWYERLLELAAAVRPVILKYKMEPLHNQDLQNCLCEFDKYERVRLGEGRPRSLYRGTLGNERQ